MTLLHYVCWENVDEDLFMDCYKAQPTVIDKQDSNGYTPLYFAVRYSNLWKVMFLIEKGANMNIKSNSGMTPIMDAASRSNAKIVKYLLEKAADTKIKDMYDKTLLDYCKTDGDKAKEGFAQIVDLLNKASGDIDDSEVRANVVPRETSQR